MAAPEICKSMMQREDLAYRFAGFELQPGERRLVQDGQPIPLTPKVFEILQLLVERAGHVISKDELLAALWPGRFVLESNLTKHIWLLRKALGESEEGGSYIETVSKVGYRFVAPVTRTARDLGAIPEPATPPVGSEAVASHGIWSRLGTLRVASAAAIVFAAAALSGWWLWHGREPVFPWSSGPPGTAVAIFEFDNLSRNSRDAWIGPAFAEMLGTDVAQGGQLHLLPEELMRSARSGAPDPDAGGFAPQTLTDLRRQFAVDYVVTGSYLASSKAGHPPVRLDLSVQDARTGATVATFSRTGSVDDLPALVTVAGADLRKDLGVKTQSRHELELAANAQPPNADVMRRIGFALDALHHYDPARARDELLQAVAEAPDYAPVYTWLAKAWSALGYKDKALAAARQAAADSADLPEFMRLQIAAQSYEAQFDWPRAIETLRKLASLQQGDPEVQLELIDVLLSAGKPRDAQAVLDTLRERGGSMSGDARLELAAAHIASSQDDTKGQRLHAARALAMAKVHGEIGLAADAERQLGVLFTSSDHKSANDMLQRSLADYRSVGNPSGEADVHRDIGNLLSDVQPRQARAEYQKSLAQFQSIGDRNGIASTYSDLAIVLWSSGDRDGAETAARNVLQISRETGNIARQAWALAALAVGQTDERASDGAIAEFREAADLDASIGARAHRGFTLYSLSDVYRLRGQLAQAANVCAQAKAEYAGLGDLVNQLFADFQCAQIALDRGDVSATEARLNRARDAAVRRGDTMTLGNVDVTRGQIQMGQAKWEEAARSIDSAKNEYAQADLTTGAAVAESLLALCDAALGKTKERDAAWAHARDLRSRVTERQEVVQVDIALAELRGETGQKDEAISQLQTLAADARKREWPGWALEAELAEMRVLSHGGDAARANALRVQIAAEARQMGFGWVLQRLQQ